MGNTELGKNLFSPGLFSGLNVVIAGAGRGMVRLGTPQDCALPACFWHPTN